MSRENGGEPHGFVAKLAADRQLRVRRKVALREQKVEDLVHGREPRAVLLAGQIRGAGRMFPQMAARSTKALVDIGFGGKQLKRDFPNAEPAEAFQGEHELRFDGDHLVAADEEHPQQVVPQLRRQEALRIVLRSTDLFRWVLFEDPAAGHPLAQLSHEAVVRHAKEPGRRIVR